MVGADQIVEGEGLVGHEFVGRVAGQFAAALADEVHGPIAVVLAAVGHAGQVGHERSVLAAAFAQFGFGLHAFGHIVEDTGKLAGGGAEGGHLEMLVQGGRILLEERGSTGQGHLSVGFDPSRFGLGEDLEDGFAEDVRGFQAGHAFEGGVDGQEAVVDRLALGIAEDFVDGEPIEHFVEEGAVVLFGAFAGGDVAGDAVHFDPAGFRILHIVEDHLGDNLSPSLAWLRDFMGEIGVGSDVPVLELGGMLAHPGEKGFSLVRREGIGHRARQDFRRGEAAQLFDRRADVHEFQRFDVHNPDDVLHGFGQGPVLAFAFPEGLLDPFGGGDVLHRAHATQRVSGIVEDRFALLLHVFERAVLQEEAVDDRIRVPGPERFGIGAVDGIPVVGMDGFDEGLVGCREGPGIQAEHPVDFLGPLQAASGQIQRPASDVRHGLGLDQLATAFPEGVFGLLARGDVGVGAPVAGYVAVFVPDWHAAAGHPDDLPRLGQDGIDDVENRLPPAENFHAHPHECRAVRFRRQVIEMQFPDHFVGPVAEDGFGHVADGGIEAGGVDLPGNGAVVAGELVIALDAGGEVQGAGFDQLFHVPAPMGDVVDDDRSGQGDRQSCEQNDPVQMVAMGREEFRGGLYGDGVGVAEGQDGAGEVSEVEAAAGGGSGVDGGDDFGRLAGAELEQIQVDERIAVQMGSHGGLEEEGRIRHGHDISEEAGGFGGIIGCPGDQKEGRGGGGTLRKKRGDAGGGCQPGGGGVLQGGIHGRHGPAIESGGDIQHGSGRFQEKDRKVGVARGGGDAESLIVEFPNMVVGGVLTAGGMFEGFPVGAGHMRDPSPCAHFRGFLQIG